MTEQTLQAQLAQALAPLVNDGSVLINDYETPQSASQQRGPWLIIETADSVQMTTGEAWTTPSARYGLYVGILSYRGGRTNTQHMNDFQTLRQQVLSTLAGLGPALGVRGAETGSPIGPFFDAVDDPDPVSLFQRLAVDVVEYEV